MNERIAILKEYILEAPAPNSEHRRMLSLLDGLVEEYEQRIQQLQKKANQCTCENHSTDI